MKKILVRYLECYTTLTRIVICSPDLMLLILFIAVLLSCGDVRVVTAIIAVDDNCRHLSGVKVKGGHDRHGSNHYLTHHKR